MIFISVLLSVVIIYFIQSHLYKKYTYDNMEYTVSLSAEEVFECEDIFLYEEITNNKNLPIPYAKVDTELPKGLKFRLTQQEKNGIGKDRYESYIQSVFVLKSKQKIKRRWRISCKTRGVYYLGNVMIVTNDLLGFNAQSKRFEIPKGTNNQVVVLPKAIDLAEHFTSSHYHSGDMILNHGLLTDPMQIAGSRDYTPYDPMNKINWKATAVHNKLMVNVEEYTKRHQFNLVLNMQARDIELHPHDPSSPEFVEQCITVCASILDRVSSENIQVRLFANTPPEDIGQECAGEDEIGAQILVTKAYQGKCDMIYALRLLAALPMKFSCPIEQLLDHMIQHPHFYAESGNIIVVSPYISERMIVFHDTMENLGVEVIFYITTVNNNALMIPPNVEIYFKTYF